MRDPEAARRAGLRKFTKRDCAVCHYVKGSHVAVHRKPRARHRQGLGAARPSRAAGQAAPGPPPSAEPPRRRRPGRSTSASYACGTCHQGPAMGYQLSLWRMSPHAQAYAVALDPRAARDRADDGRRGGPAGSRRPA